MYAGPVIAMAMGGFFAWCAISIIRNGYFDGRNHRRASGKKRYYRAAYPLYSWFVAISFLLLAAVLITTALLHVAGVRVIGE